MTHAIPDSVRFLYAFPVTHRQRGGDPMERWHWELDTPHGFRYRGDNDNGRGWASKAAAIRAGRKVMLAYFTSTRTAPR